MKMPAELGKEGRALWRDVVAKIEFFDPREVLALRQACQLEDDLGRLRRQLETSELVVKGSTGQPVESPLLGSIRQAVALQARLLASIAIEAGAADRSRAGRRLVAARYA